jgi:hypothetical protein
MKTASNLNKRGGLAPKAAQATQSTAPAIPEPPPPPAPQSVQRVHVAPDRNGERLRELMDRRYTDPLPCERPYRHWGINE